MIEIQEFRKSLVAWLQGIAGVTAQLGTRVYHSWPQTPPTYPMVTFTVRKRPATDYPGHAWAGTVTINVLSVDDEVADAIEDAILEDMSDGDVVNDLSTATKTTCPHFAYTETLDDEPVFDLVEGSYVHTRRSMAFEFLLIGLAEG